MSFLDAADVLGSRALTALAHVEGHALAVFQRTRASIGHVVDVYEDVVAIVALDKAVPFTGIEPLDSTCFLCQCN